MEQNVLTNCSGSLAQVYSIQSGHSLDLYGACGNVVNMGETSFLLYGFYGKRDPVGRERII